MHTPSCTIPPNPDLSPIDIIKIKCYDDSYDDHNVVWWWKADSGNGRAGAGRETPEAAVEKSEQQMDMFDGCDSGYCFT